MEQQSQQQAEKIRKSRVKAISDSIVRKESVILHDLLSGSPSVAISLKIFGDKFHGKVFQPLPNVKDCNHENALKYEADIYRCAVTYLTKMSPNFVEFVDFLPVLSGEIPELQQALVDVVHFNDKCVYNVKLPYYILITQVAGGKTLDKATVSDADLPGVVAQVLISIAMMHSIGLQHNDLHIGNIFVEELPEPVTFKYMVNENVVANVVSKYFVRIFDWDLSFFKPYGSNVKTRGLAFYEDIGIVNLNDRVFDVTTFLCTLGKYKGPKNPEIRKLLDSVFIDYDKFAERTVKKPYFECRPPLSGRKNNLFKIKNDEMLFQNILKLPYFKSSVVQLV
jgi:hypothetical protein